MYSTVGNKPVVVVCVHLLLHEIQLCQGKDKTRTIAVCYVVQLAALFTPMVPTARMGMVPLDLFRFLSA